jgi:superfamily I DNA and/or RNA helicase
MDKSVRVGLPLLVHRRCAQPMFAISNEVAYAGKMVQAKEPKTSKVLEVLGPSRWLHVTGAGSGKWCAAEADAVVDLLRRLVDQGIEEPDIFFITPFRIVAQNMRSVLSASDAVKRITDRPWQWARERVGTVHTVQGREAEAVFLVLGAPEETQNGARSWASYPPNLVNVAVSRAQEALYVIGNRALWQKHGCFGVVSRRLAS